MLHSPSARVLMSALSICLRRRSCRSSSCRSNAFCSKVFHSGPEVSCAHKNRAHIDLPWSEVGQGDRFEPRTYRPWPFAPWPARYEVTPFLVPAVESGGLQRRRSSSLGVRPLPWRLPRPTRGCPNIEEFAWDSGGTMKLTPISQPTAMASSPSS